MNIKQLIHHESFSGGLLVFTAIAAMILANSPGNEAYQGFLSLPVEVVLGNFEIAKPLLLWVNDGLMALFFLLIGLEVKREMLDGDLSSAKQIILPGIAAIAGIVFPALIYVFFTINDPVGIRGWAIPSATDIAFALGVFSLFGKRLPLSLKLFLLSVAIFDDIGAIVIIALFYSADLSTASLSIGLIGLVILFLLNRFRVNNLAPYTLLGLIVWVAVLKSGVHATLAGFAIAWFIPLKLENNDGHAMSESLEHSLHPWIAFFVLPLFAFANAGVNLTGIGAEAFFSSITLGIALGLFVGKQVGIFGVCWLVIRLKLTELPKDATWAQFYGVSLLCGIGFTMSLFIGTLAFEDQALAYQTNVKLGVIIGSLASAVVAVMVLNASKSRFPTTPSH
ncbi:MAG: NhaA family Na+:H+ antiporter [Arenicella sp.]